MYSYLTNIMLLIAIAYALRALYSNIPLACCTHYFTVCLLTATQCVNTVVGQYLPCPPPALCIWVCFSNSNWNFNCDEDYSRALWIIETDKQSIKQNSIQWTNPPSPHSASTSVGRDAEETFNTRGRLVSHWEYGWRAPHSKQSVLLKTCDGT